ncbi:MAG: hypothetical protein AMJ88_04115 [Anaerolineae bacterium SM23_ 63]|nr:MAG: hypothetical protein AMJ88_04115 [Anaerolineae bacterium SM23_ 63]HEY45206.1 hypothetical protein [Anaerolineae bacterium]
MKFEASHDFSSHREHLKSIREVWLNHPLRDDDIDEALSRVVVLLQPSIIFGLNITEYPFYSLGIPDSEEQVDPELVAALTHELTRLIDRHDRHFTVGLLSEEIDTAIKHLPVRRFASVRRSLRCFWNTYIDGRLERRGMAVHSLNDRFEEKIGTTRLLTGRYEGHEVAALSKVRHSEPHTFVELSLLAWIFPYYRAPEYRNPTEPTT